MVWTPYGDRMQAVLTQNTPEIKFHIEVDGQSGDLVTKQGNFLNRITKRCKRKSEPQDEPLALDGWLTPPPGNKSTAYSWVVVLGGTNDLAYGFSATEIFDALRKCYDVAFEHGAKVLALTVPECSAKNAGLDERRDALNTLVKEYKAENL
jgi:hypothetical protein